jgi:hypothetical protein
MAAIPPHELDLLTITVDEAIELAGEGEREDAYDCLYGGLCRVEDLAAEEDAPWGPELLARWRHALEQFSTLYGVRRD